MSGWKLVPVEATEEMGHVSGMRAEITPSTAAITQWGVNKWDAMLSAAPSPPDEVLERMAGAFLSAWLGERDPLQAAIQQAIAIDAMRAALAAAEGEQASIPKKSGPEHE